jgi:hypothetical protein
MFMGLNLSISSLTAFLYNRHVTRPPTLLPALCALFLLLGCSSGPLQVGTIQIGRSVNEDSSVGSFTTVFKPNDTVYVSVHTTDMGSGTITVKWSYNGRLVSERSKEVSYKISAATEFHLQSATGFPAGPYTVEVLLDAKLVGSRSFTVEK